MERERERERKKFASRVLMHRDNAIVTSILHENEFYSVFGQRRAAAPPIYINMKHLVHAETKKKSNQMIKYDFLQLDMS